MKEVIEAFDSIAEFYDEYMEQTGHLEAQRRIIEKLGLRGSILDVGAGTGSYRPRNADVVILDPSPRMLAHSKIERKVLGVAEALPFKDKSFDCVLSMLGFSWFRDKDRALSEMRRVGRRVIIVEEEGKPTQKRGAIPEHLVPFFERIEKLETPFEID